MFVFLLFLVFASIIFGGGGTTIQFCLGHPFGQQQPWAWPPPLNLRGPTAKSVQWAHNSHQWHWVQSWFQAHPQFITLVLPPYSHFPYCNQTEAFFSTWRWRFSIGPLTNKSLFSRPWMMPAMSSQEEILTWECQAWICHARIFFQDV